MKTVIEFQDVSKEYVFYNNKKNTLKEKLITSITRRNKEVLMRKPILNNVCFKIYEGETVAFIGENGTGKSTTLKLIAKIIETDSGVIKTVGKVASLLEIGAGFNPEMTGKENVYLYGTLLGLSKKEIEKQYESIVAFSELRDYMDTIVKNYSSGMYMRLAFSVAAHVNPDILLVDEVLAVGDESFQQKCLSKIYEFQKCGKTILFVSHDMNLVRKICDRSILLKKDGSIIDGETDQIVNLYLKSLYGHNESNTGIDIKSFDTENRWGNRYLEIKNVSLVDALTGKLSNAFYTNDHINIKVKLKNNNFIEKAVLGFAIFTEDGHYIIDRNSYLDDQYLINIGDEKEVIVTLKNIPLLKGKYLLTVTLYDEFCQMPYDHQHQMYSFMIMNNRKQMPSVVDIKCSWEL